MVAQIKNLKIERLTIHNISTSLTLTFLVNPSLSQGSAALRVLSALEPLIYVWVGAADKE
jgi:hypothetical protein